MSCGLAVCIDTALLRSITQLLTGLDKRSSSAPLVVTADEICAFLRGSTFLAWRCSVTGEGLQEGPGPFKLSLALPVPPALLLTHQLHHLWHYKKILVLN